MPQFSHLHVHTQYSLLDGAASVENLIKKAKSDNMPAIAITDHGNMFGVFKFVAEANKHNIKPIVGCEFYMVADRHKKQFTKEVKDKRCHQLLLAKNTEGYRNLTTLCSIGYIEGLYSKWPRIDKELLLKHHKGLIATTCCLGAEVPQAILHKGEKEAEILFKWWLDLFGEDYYIELQRHHLPDQEKVNEVLLRFAKKYNVKIICSNDSHYVDVEDANAHDILLCVNTGEFQKTPIATDEEGGRGYRFGFPNDQFYFKTQNEMALLFKDLPQALDNTNEIVSKVEILNLKKDILLPNFVIPDNYANQDDFLEHITWEGAKKRYQTIDSEIEDRIKFELFTIKTMGFAGYFLIVADFIKAGRDLGVFVGPGRGSAAGSVVAYCISITNIDPLKYNLLFERFLNPDRKSMPDIDTDFDDEGRQKVIDYVVDKYGRNQVAQIITYGTMAAKMSIKDVSRVLELPLQDANTLAKLVPTKAGISLSRVINAPITGPKSLKEKEGLGAEELESVKTLREIAAGDDLRARVLKEALILEGSVRNTGTHAAGIIIAPKDLTEIIPVCTSKETDLWITQFEGKIIEDAGVIKMDILGLKTLTILKTALKLIKQNHKVEIEIDAIPLDDKKTFELYQNGATNGTFQFESAGMQKYLKDLKPDKFDDLIAMNALYRPGPIEYIPDFINRKLGKEQVIYDLPEMEEFLKETYGITIYQEQVMLLSQKLANFSKGDADVLRKAMGKKDKGTLDKMKSKFMEGCITKGFNTKICDKIWVDWEAFASYAFNKSHSTCYAFVAYQTAYLKAHYPSEYMSAVLSHNQNDIDKITFFMEECQQMGINVLGPDVNESNILFTVNKEGAIRFGLSAIKGLGEAPSMAIVEDRSKNGFYTDVFDFSKRLSAKIVNKRSYEALILSGSFDSFKDITRACFYSPTNDGGIFIDEILKFSNSFQNKSIEATISLFDAAEIAVVPPPIPQTKEWERLEKLTKEKSVVGIYITGHPLDDYKLEIKSINPTPLSKFSDHTIPLELDILTCALITNVITRYTKSGKPFYQVVLEDYTGSYTLNFFEEKYKQHQLYLQEGAALVFQGAFKQGYSGFADFNVNTITYINEFFKTFTGTLFLKIPLSIITTAFLKQVVPLIESIPKGKTNLVYIVYSDFDNEQLSIKMEDYSKKICLSQDFLTQLKPFERLEYLIK